MLKLKSAKRGVALFIVLGTILIVVILANVVLSIILSHSRLTHHQISRIRAHYAGLAGMNYALEQLRTGTWTWPNDYCIGNITAGHCVGFPPANFVNDQNMPYEVRINIQPPDPTRVNFPDVAPLNINVNYTSPAL
jgi:Tfp pilus assembly protein PilX